MNYTSPRLIDSNDILTNFNSGQPELDHWLKNKAYKNQKSGASRTYVVCFGTDVVGYYCLSVGSITRQEVSGKVARNMPDPIPVMVLGRLAVDVNHQGKGIGLGLIKDAVQRTLKVSEIAGVRALLVHAIDDSARNFYMKKCGFKPSKFDEYTLLVTIGDIVKALG